MTGGGGFVGRHLMNALFARKGAVTVLARNQAAIDNSWQAVPMTVCIGDLKQPSSLSGVCDGVETVFHLAGFAHAVDIDDKKAREQHERITVEGTRALISQATRASVRRFMFVSSVKGMGEGVTPVWTNRPMPGPYPPTVRQSAQRSSWCSKPGIGTDGISPWRVSQWGMVSEVGEMCHA